ncbi:3TM-type holin [Marinimicrobium agarilyticum]|uniref:3TM-type holin n=1 Tax=Marinimicrobium agarilyticum TaxID=306546 RepID=UPI000428013F|nr:3TM-type holin [Marinimicrobium agarilyticum]
MNIFGFLGELIKPVTGLIDDLHTSDAEKYQLKNELVAMQNEMAGKLVDYERKVLDAQSKIITAEAQGQGWLQRSWRPITMLTFLVLVVLDTMGLTEFRLSGEAWTLLQIGLGGYVVGRSAEKIAPQLKQVLKRNE